VIKKKQRATWPKMPADEEAKTAVLEAQLDDEDRYSPRASDAGVSLLEREFLPAMWLGCVSHGVQIHAITLTSFLV